MPRSYANGKIYCIRNRAAGDSIVYVGSTTQALCERMSGHRCAIKHNPNMKLYKLMGDVGVEHFHIELINDFGCERKDQLLTEEGRHIRELRPACNTLIAGRTKQEYYKDNVDTIAARDKAYREDNADTIAARQKAYQEANADTIAARKKAHYAAHADTIKASVKAYYAAHADTIKARVKAYRESHADTIAASDKAYDEAHADTIAARKKAVYERKKAERLAAAATAALASIAIVDAPTPA